LYVGGLPRGTIIVILARGSPEKVPNAVAEEEQDSSEAVGSGFLNYD
jgi:hypothetical protein